MNLGKLFIGLGVLFLVLGAAYLVFEKLGWAYRNPLDLAYKKGNIQFYFPLGTSLLVSVLLTLLFYLLKK